MTWEAPPPIKKASKTDWAKEFDDIRSGDGQWKNMGRYPASYVTRIRAGSFPTIKKGEFDATCRDIDEEQKGLLYIRWAEGSIAEKL